MADWWIFQGNRTRHEDIEALPPPPPWRKFQDEEDVFFWADDQIEQKSHMQNSSRLRGETFQARPAEIQLVNTALYLRRPLLVTGTPGTGKSSLAYAIAYELQLGPVLRWPITSSSTLEEGLYSYDAIGRLEQARDADRAGESTGDIGRFITLGPLGTALLSTKKPRVLLIDEVDKSDIDLPNNLLNIFEEGEFIIPQLARLPSEPETGIEVFTHDTQMKVPVQKGRITCFEFPIIVLTSNEERMLPSAFMRRCIQLEMPQPTSDKLAQIVKGYFKDLSDTEQGKSEQLISEFLSRQNKGDLATDQLLNAIYLVSEGLDLADETQDSTDLLDAVFRYLNSVK